MIYLSCKTYVETGYSTEIDGEVWLADDGLAGLAIALLDPLIVQLPASAKDFRATISLGPAGVRDNTPLAITAGLTSVPIDATNNLVAEAGKQLVIVDFQSPEQMPPGTYYFSFDFPGTMLQTGEIKVVFAGKYKHRSADGSTKTYYPPLFPCVTDFARVPALSLSVPIMALAQIDPVARATTGCNGKVYDFRDAAASPTVDVVEFYNASLDHYFITHGAAEIANLDAGHTPTRWTRTGQTFKAYATPHASTSDICRYYIPPGLGDSHFFGRGTVECTSTGQRFPALILEDATFMRMFLPNAGACPTNTTPVYRVFSNRADANHRYMTDPAIRQQMVAAGWLAEGDGGDLVVMCAPQ